MNLQTVVERARNAFWLRACAQVGDEPRLRGRPTVSAFGGQIRIGDRFGLASRPVPSHLMTGPDGVLEIGHDVSIGHGAAIAAYERVQIGHGTRIGPFVIIMDTNFHGAAGDQSVQHDCRPVVIGDGCRIGSRVTITRGGSVGHGAEILAGSVVSTAIPPGACAGGGRARVVGRAGEAASRWDGVAAALPSLVMQSLKLDVPPELDTDPSGVPQWDDLGVLRLLAAIERSFGVGLDPTAVNSAQSFADIAVAIERARDRSRSVRPPGLD
jgi:acetyltransferase-like isoleucine patch superfamily enzyme